MTGSLTRRGILRGIAALPWMPGLTLAQGADRELSRIAFGSCANQEKPQPIWDAILAAMPDLFIFAGDNVYGDVRDGKAVTAEAELIPSLRAAYAKARGIPGFMAAKERLPHLAVWDDHDYGKNDAGADFAGKYEAQTLFAEFWALPPDDPRRSRDGVYHAVTIGPPGRRVQIILLDTRFFRSPWRQANPRGPGRERYEPDDDPGKTMLGEAQWGWLAERLREPAELRLVVSTIQVLAEAHGWERWGNLPRERLRLLDLIDQTSANGVIFLSGDRHIGAIYRQTKGVYYALYEVTSSGLTEYFAGNRELGPNRLVDVYSAENFGVIEIDWAQMRVGLSLRDMGGAVVRGHSVALEGLVKAK